MANEAGIRAFLDSGALSVEPVVSMDQDAEPRLPAELLRSLDFPIQPQRLVALLKRADRKDVASELLVRTLEGYARAQKQSEAQVTVGDVSTAELEQRAVFNLQLMGQLLEAFGSELLNGDLDRILHFIDYACTQPPHEPSQEQGTMATLLNIQNESVDAAPAHDWELITTALNLLLSLLEGNPTVTLQNTPMLHVLRAKIEHLRDAPNGDVRSLSQEVVLVLTAREKQTAPSTEAAEQPKYLDVYQEALRYLQDPIIPVRAHGLHLLAQLVSKDTRDVSYGNTLDPALLPAIFDIFVHAIQDEESFLYLNAVKGLAQMTAHWRDATLRPLIALYVGGEKTEISMTRALAYGQELSQRETDKRLRIGEAILQVLQHCGEAITPAIDVIVNPLLTGVRNPRFSATLRSSFISILGTCVEFAPTALASSGAANEMVQLCGDLVKIESVPRSMTRKSAVTGRVTGRDEHGNTKTMQLDEEEEKEQRDEREARAGIDVDPKLPQLRRSALLLLAVLLRSTRHQLDAFVEDRSRDIESDGPDTLTSLRLPGGSMLPDTGAKKKSHAAPALLVSLDAARRILPTVSYTSSEDVDALVQQQARDCIQEVQLLEAAYVTAHAAGLP